MTTEEYNEYITLVGYKTTQFVETVTNARAVGSKKACLLMLELRFVIRYLRMLYNYTLVDEDNTTTNNITVKELQSIQGHLNSILDTAYYNDFVLTT